MIGLVITVVVLALMLGVSIALNIAQKNRLDTVRDAIEECLDIIDSKYASISEILARPLFFDSAEIRKVVQDIKSTKTALHQIAYALDNTFEGDTDEDGNAR